MTAQSLFDAVARHLLTQAAPSRALSLAAQRCYYRHPDTPWLRCAIGGLIPVDRYDPTWDADVTVWAPAPLAGTDISTLSAVRAAIGCPDDLVVLAQLLQDTHDAYAVSTWPAVLRTLSAQYGLSSAVLDDPSSLRLSPALARDLGSPEVRYGTRATLFPLRASFMADPGVRPIIATEDGPALDGQPVYRRDDVIGYALASEDPRAAV